MAIEGSHTGCVFVEKYLHKRILLKLHKTVQRVSLRLLIVPHACLVLSLVGVVTLL